MANIIDKKTIKISMTPCVATEMRLSKDDFGFRTASWCHMRDLSKHRQDTPGSMQVNAAPNTLI